MESFFGMQSQGKVHGMKIVTFLSIHQKISSVDIRPGQAVILADVFENILVYPCVSQSDTKSTV